MLVTFEWPAPGGHRWNEIPAFNMRGQEIPLGLGEHTWQAKIIDVQMGAENEFKTEPGVEVLGDHGYKTIIVTLWYE